MYTVHVSLNEVWSAVEASTFLLFYFFATSRTIEFHALDTYMLSTEVYVTGIYESGEQRSSTSEVGASNTV